MIYRPSNLPIQTSKILNSDRFIVYRGKTTYTVEGKILKEKINSYLNSPANYYKSESEGTFFPCVTQGDLYQLGYDLLVCVGYSNFNLSEGLPVRLVEDDIESDLFWMYKDSSTICFLSGTEKRSFSFEDSTPLSQSTIIQSISGLFLNSVSIPHRIIIKEE